MAVIYILLNSEYCSEVFTSLQFASDMGQIFTFTRKKNVKIYLPYTVLSNLIRQLNVWPVMSFRRISFLSLKGPEYCMVICNITFWHKKK